MARKSKSDILEWTVTDAPDAAETEALPPSAWESAPAPPEPEARASDAQARAHHFQISRRIWLTLGTAIVGLLLGAGLFTLWNRYRIKGEVERFVAAEEQAALAGDTQKIKQLTDNGDAAWLFEHAALAEGNQAAPAPLSILWALPESGTPRSIRSIASDTVQVDVARRYVAPDGATVTFTLPQFYRYAKGEWKRIAPPKTTWGEETTRPGLRVNVTYYPIDEDFAVELSDYLEGMLAQVCAAWACPDDLKMVVKLSTTSVPANSFYYYSPFSPGSLLISLMDSGSFNVIYGGPTLTLASPHAVGYPADAASADLLKRVIALETLAIAARQIAPDSGNNEFLYALVERMAVRFKLEPSKVAEMRFVNPGLVVEDLWGTGGSEPPSLGGERLRGAFAVVNRLLRDQPANADIKLFNSLSSASDPVAWLSAGMGIPHGEAQARLRALTDGPYPINVLTTDPHDLTLACPDGVAVLSRGDAQPTPLLSEYVFESYPIGWSPDGKRLALALSGQSAVVDFELGAVLWPPRSSNSYNIMGWAADTVVIAYRSQSQSTDSSASNPILTFYDFADPGRKFPELPGIQQYILSPDKSLAALMLPSKNRNDGPSGQLALMPALGGPLTLVDENAYQPTWSPHGDALAYLRSTFDAVSLWVANPTTVMTREVWSIQESGLPAQSSDFQIVWSPAGDLIALTSNIYSSSNQSWTVLAQTDGSGARVILPQQGNAAIYPSGFSADGKYFALTRLHPRNWSLSTTLIYDTATGDVIRTLSNMMGWTPWSSAWSPTGHALVLNSYDGVYLLADPSDPNSLPEQLTGERCFAMMWNPRP